MMTSIYAEVVPAARERLAAGGQQGRCRGCETVDWATQFAIAAVVDPLPERSVADVYAEGGGMCLPHALATISSARANGLGHLTRVLLRRLGPGQGSAALFQVLVGRDPDAEARRRLRESLPPEAHGGSRAPPTLERVRGVLEIESCPACLAGGQMERRYLGWLRRERARTSQVSEDELLGLCPQHFRDLVDLDPGTAMWLADLERANLVGLLARFEGWLRDLPPASLLARLGTLTTAWRESVAVGRSKGRRDLLGAATGAVASAFRSRRRALDDARLPLFHRHFCSACHAVAVAERREMQLLLSALEDGPTARCYEQAHGLCLRHVFELPAGEQRELPRKVLAARLAVLDWELEEAERKRSWTVRYEAQRAEATAWSRTPALLDGRVYLGGPPAVSVLSRFASASTPATGRTTPEDGGDSAR
jgi:hypothetical protein